LDQAFIEVLSKGEVNKFNLIKSIFKMMVSCLMGTWVPDLRQVEIAIDLVEMSHKRSGFQSTRLEPRNRSTTSPLVINHALHD
jgi:hypothetical protein